MPTNLCFGGGSLFSLPTYRRKNCDNNDNDHDTGPSKLTGRTMREGTDATDQTEEAGRDGQNGMGRILGSMGRYWGDIGGDLGGAYQFAPPRSRRGGAH